MEPIRTNPIPTAHSHLAGGASERACPAEFRIELIVWLDVLLAEQVNLGALNFSKLCHNNEGERWNDLDKEKMHAFKI